MITKSGTYLLKSSLKEKYREWLQAEAVVLEKLVSQSIIPVPHYYGFLEEQNSSHLIMSYEQGITLTTSIAQAKTDTAKFPFSKNHISTAAKIFPSFFHQSA